MLCAQRKAVLRLLDNQQLGNSRLPDPYRRVQDRLQAPERLRAPATRRRSSTPPSRRESAHSARGTVRHRQIREWVQADNVEALEK